MLKIKYIVAISVGLSTSLPVLGGGTETADYTLLGLGAGTAVSSTSAEHNTFIGVNAGTATTSSSNTFVGSLAGEDNVGGSANTFIGSNAGRKNTSGNYNSFIGSWAGASVTTGRDNTFVGDSAGTNSTTATYNSFFGSRAGLENTTGEYNTYLGTSSGIQNSTGSSNVIIGSEAGFFNLSGSHNVFLGYYTGIDSVVGSGNVFLGSQSGGGETGSNRLYIENSSASNPLIYGEFDNDIVAINGTLGVGTQMPGAPLHVQRTDGSAQAFIEDTSTTSSPRTLVKMHNFGRPEIVMGNTATGGEWSFGAGTNFILKQGAVGTASSAKNKHLTLYSGTGNLEISGSIITGGPTCSAGCDVVFSENYPLPSIAEHAEKMYALGHLPNVGPTAPNQPINLTDHIGKLLNELEHAHIYIAQLEKTVSVQQLELQENKDDIAAQHLELTQVKNQLISISVELNKIFSLKDH